MFAPSPFTDVCGYRDYSYPSVGFAQHLRNVVLESCYDDDFMILALNVVQILQVKTCNV